LCKGHVGGLPPLPYNSDCMQPGTGNAIKSATTFAHRKGVGTAYIYQTNSLRFCNSFPATVILM
jgi:hypothetical protein